MAVADALLNARNILIVEDDYFIAEDMLRGMKKHGAIVLGPVASVQAALMLIDTEAIDGAVLDINLGDENAFPVADALKERGIPFLFVTGYDLADIPPAYRQVPTFGKPVNPATIASALSSGELAA